MQTQKHRQSSDKSRDDDNFPLIRLVLVTIIILLIAIGVAIWAYLSPGIAIVYTIVAGLGILLAFLQVIPSLLSTDKSTSSIIVQFPHPHATPPQPIHISTQVPAISERDGDNQADPKPSSANTTDAPLHSELSVPPSSFGSETAKQSQTLHAPINSKAAIEMPASSSSEDVFHFNVPLPDQGEFYGRKRERLTLIGRTRKGASTSIVGPHRIGKTWLVNYLKKIAFTELGTHYRIVDLVATADSIATVSALLEQF